MPARIVGMIGTQQEGIAVHLIKGQISRQWVIDFTRLHEQWNYDSVLVGYYASAAEGFAIALYAADHTERIKFLIAHRPGSVAPALAATGMVTAALSADLNGDNKPELVLAGEWMPIKIYEFASGKLNEVAAKYGLKNTEGWWNKLVADDIDGDGDMDLLGTGRKANQTIWYENHPVGNATKIVCKSSL